MKRLPALLLLLAACAPTRTVTIDGQAVPYEQAAQHEFARAKALYDEGKFGAAAAAFNGFIERYPESKLVDEALFRRGQALARVGQYEQAQAVLQQMLEKYPSSSWKKPAAAELGLVQSKLGKSEAAAQSLKPMAEQMIPGGPESEAQLKDFTEVLESAPAAEVARLVAEMDKKSPAWPLAALKLARIQLHTGDRVHASELAAEILTATGGQGPYADGARTIQRAAQPAGAVKPNLLGIVLPLSGDLKGFADQALNGIALTIDLQNRGPIHVEIKDTRGEADSAADAVDELAQAGAIAILGPLGVSEGLAAATRAQQLGIPLVSLSRAEGLTALGDYIFRDMPTSSAQARAVAEYAQKKLNVKGFGILQPESPYGEEMTRYFWDTADANGVPIRAYEHYPRETTTFKPFIQSMVGRTAADLEERQQYTDELKKIIEEIKDPYKRRKAASALRNAQAPIVDFEALFIPDSARTVRLVAPAIAAEDVITAGCDTKELEVVKKTTKNEQLRTVQLLGTSLWDSPELTDERSGVARYVQCSIFVDVFFANSERPATRKFVDDYGNSYHRAPGFLEAHAFDAAALIKKALDERHPLTREEMRNALSGMTRPLEGAAGDTIFGKDREAQKSFFWLWINRGTIVEFDPEGPPPVPPAAPQVPPAPPQPSKPR
jgi:ABC-type branched-subunit amino acid transport system substrate-binding protein/thioredoxin-like negative regulator of GroEL